MSTKTEEKLKRMLDEQMEKHIEKHIEVVNERAGGMFLYGFIVGVIMSYGGFLSYVAGVGTGVMLSQKYKYIVYQITDKVGYMFQSVIDRGKID